MNTLSEEEQKRYSRHLILKEIGPEGQMRIKEGRGLVIGAGGLGSPVLMYLAAAGTGVIGVADGDIVDISNLQRQVIHATADAGKMKAESARETINALNPNVRVNLYREYLTTAEAMNVMKDYDFVIDATDNYESKLLINDVCVAAGKPFSHGAVLRFQGQTFTWLPGHACYRCMFGAEPPAGEVPSCAQAGLLGTIHRSHTSHRGAEISHRHGPAAHRQAADIRRTVDGVQPNPGEPQSGVPDVRKAGFGDRTTIQKRDCGLAYFHMIYVKP